LRIGRARLGSLEARTIVLDRSAKRRFLRSGALGADAEARKTAAAPWANVRSNLRRSRALELRLRAFVIATEPREADRLPCNPADHDGPGTRNNGWPSTPRIRWG
jgi:hypothetical protein